MAEAQQEGSSLTARGVLGWLAMGALALWLGWMAAAVFAFGLPYWLTPIAERPEAALHEPYRPGGIVGLATGFMGTGLMFGLLLYSLRKWIPFTSFMGSPTFWMRFHVVCGVMGPVFILLHDGFKLPTGITGVGFWAMLLVSISGFFGRYLFGYIPLTAANRRAELQEAQQRYKQLSAKLVAETRNAEREDQVQYAVALARDLEFNPTSLGELTLLNIELRRRMDLIEALLYRAGLPDTLRRRATHRLLNQLRMKAEIGRWEVVQRYSKYWQLAHQPLALAMYLIIFIHILQALLFGGVIGTILTVFGE